VGASERIRAAFIGVGNRGGQLLEAALPNRDLEVVALCDLWRPALEKQGRRVPEAALETDFRRVLDRKDLDAVFIATPDHWHAVQCIWACDAGLDVYVEKPLSVTVYEGRRMVEAARRGSRVVQVGTHRRSSALYPLLAEYVRSGAAGKITVASAYRISNMWPKGIGRDADSDPPEGFDWDMWLGPRPKRRYNPTIHPYKFRWWKAYSSQLGNWGVHYFDVIRWVLEEEAPVSVSAHGGRFAVEDNRDIPDTLQVTFEFASGRLLNFGQYEASGLPAILKGEIELRGTRAMIIADERGFESIPETAGQFQEKGARSAAKRVEVPQVDATVAHIRNFLDCVKSRRLPNADVETGHRSTTFCHLGNIALATRSRVEWDARAERAVGNSAANRLLHYQYRSPWKLG
jgi:predicted dehydrogenase